MSYAPPGESAQDLWVERSNLDGVVLAGVAYGVFFTVAVQCVQLLLHGSNSSSKSSRALLLYTFILFALGTIGFGGNTKFNEMTYVDDRNYPGGPNAFTADFYSDPVNLMSFASYVIMSWIADGLVLYRFIMLWNYNHWMIPIPALMYLGSISMSIALMVALRSPGGSFWTTAAVNFGIAFWSLSISLNIILTILISTKLLLARKKVKNALGVEHSKTYTSIMAMLIESAALFSIWGLVFIISYARGSAFQNVILPPLGLVQGIAPLLIIFRVAQGRAWSRDTFTVGSTQHFKVKRLTKSTTQVASSITANSVELQNLGSSINIDSKGDVHRHGMSDV